MPCLTDVLQVLAPDVDETPEDIFASAPGLIFTDDIVNLHGSPDATIIYKSSSHYLWNAGLKLAELISFAPAWAVEGETVLELGAGVGLAGIVRALAGTEKAVLTDYPSQVVLDTLRKNVSQNLLPSQLKRITIAGQEWGVLNSPFAMDHAHCFTRVPAADCLWMPHQQANLINSILHFLSHAHSSRIYVVAGSLTGRVKLAAFFDVASENGLCVEEIFEEDAEGSTRSWDPARGGGTEDHTERKKWLVVAKLKRDAQYSSSR